MDLLFHRYASPFLLLDQIIPAGELSEFVNKFWKACDEQNTWEFFLSKVFDMSYADFKESLKPQKMMSEEEIEATINESLDIMNSFIPERSEN